MDDLAQQLEVLAASGADVTTQVALIKAAQQTDGGWGLDLDKTFPSEVIDTISALRALSVAGAADVTVAGNALGFLLGNQNADGGWSAARGQPSQVFYTSLTLLVLKDFQAIIDLSAFILAASDFLIGQQNIDGSFGTPAGTVFETALALQAMLRYVVDTTKSSSALNYLVLTQAANGSWAEDAYSTALALRVLQDALVVDQDIDNDGDGFTERLGDCDDTNPSIFPGAPDLTVNGIDENCDGIDGPPVGGLDADADGFTPAQGDCDDTNPSIFPEAPDLTVNGIDENCDGIDGPPVGDLDTDADGFTPAQGDCDDTNPNIFPGAPDLTVNGIDENCDGIDGPPVGNLDTDADGFTPAQGDCDDANPDIHPGAVDIPNNGIDENCDGQDAFSSTQITSVSLFKVVDSDRNPATVFGADETMAIEVTVNGVLTGPSSNAILIGPSSYLSSSDSPFALTDFSSGYTFLEDFEDHLFNTPGVSASAGGVTSVVFGPRSHDSVDADDGLIDGSGLNGDNYFSDPASTGILFSFDETILGSFPTHAGLVWTDGAGTISFEAFDADGASLGTLSGNHADETFEGTTADDRFYGTINLSGISAVFISNSIGGIELDHLQYGSTGVSDSLLTLFVTDPAGQVLDVRFEEREFRFDTLNRIPGDYVLVARAIDATTGLLLDEEKTPFSIQPGVSIANEILTVIPLFTHVGATETVTLTLSMTNRSNIPAVLTIEHEVKSPSGLILNSGVTPLALLQEVTSINVTLATFDHVFFESGDYPVQAKIFNGTTLLATLSRTISATPDESPTTAASSTIVSEKISYSSNESVMLISIVTSQSPNASLTNLEATVTITDPGAISIFTQTLTLADLLPSARVEFKFFTNTGTNPAGLYTAALEVQSAGAPLTTSQTSFEILSSLEQANALSGTIDVTPGSILETESTTFLYTVENTGNEIDLPIIQVDILVVDPDTGLPVRTILAETSLNGREVFADSFVFDSTGLGPKPYLVVLQATTAGVTQTLNSAGLIINPIPNTAPTANAGPDQSSLTGQLIVLDGSASSDPDGDPLTFQWHFVSVPQDSLITDAALDDANIPSPSFIPDLEGIYVLRLVVNDGLFDSPQDTVSIFINPAPAVDIHPETINLKSNGGSKSVTGVLTSPILSSFEFFTAEDGVTVMASFRLENQYIDINGNFVVFSIPADIHPASDFIEAVDADGDGDIDLYRLTLKFNRDLLIAGVTDINGLLWIAEPTDLISTVIGDGQNIGSDTNKMIAPPKVSKGK